MGVLAAVAAALCDGLRPQAICRRARRVHRVVAPLASAPSEGQLGLRSVDDALFGAVTFIQRGDSSRLTPHRMSFPPAAAFKQALEQRLRTASVSGLDLARRRQLVVFDVGLRQ